jgi:hypothetical protein
MGNKTIIKYSVTKEKLVYFMLTFLSITFTYHLAISVNVSGGVVVGMHQFLKPYIFRCNVLAGAV